MKGDRYNTQTLSPRLIVLISNDVSYLLWLTSTCRDRRIPFWSSVRGRMHFDHIAVDSGRSIGGVSPGVGVKVNEGEDEGVQEKRDASGKR